MIGTAKHMQLHGLLEQTYNIEITVLILAVLII
jgi:hypothetical protein